MSKIEISSSFFIDDSDFPKYVKELSFVKNDQDFNEVFNFIKENNNSIIQTFEKYNNYLVYGDVQSGKTNNLIYITEKIVSKYNYNFVIFLAGTKNDLMFQNQERFFKSFEVMNDEKYVVFNSKGKGKRNISAFDHIIRNNKIAIIHSLKRPDTLSELFRTISKVVGEKRILIIDDEGDEASLSDKTMDAINLFKNIKDTKFISITATPFANLATKKISYDYFHILKSPSTYTSLKQMDGCIVEINKNNFDAFIWPLIEFAQTVVSSKKERAQILFNVFNEKDSHDAIVKNIQGYIDQFVNLDILDIIKDKYSVKFDSKLVSDFYKKLDSRNIITSNGDYANNEKMDIEIIVGGLKLSRGLTYENLISEVMLNMGDKIKASTLIQRARWLGHRGSDVNIIKVYTTKQIKEAFVEARHLIRWTKNYHISTNDFVKKFKSNEYERIEL